MELSQLSIDWRQFERFVAGLYAGSSTDDVTVIPNAKLVGVLSGKKRQVDVLIDSRFENDAERRIIIDAKQRRRKIDVKEVEAFEGMMRDCRAQYGILVCVSGYTKAALRRAQRAITIKLLTSEEVEEFGTSGWEECIGNCASKHPRCSEAGMVLYSDSFGLAVNNSPLSVLVIGKCDQCGDFHIWCWDCGNKFALGNNDEFKCDCDRFWLTAVEEHEDMAEPGIVRREVLLLLNELTQPFPGIVVPVIIQVDRRPLN